MRAELLAWKAEAQRLIAARIAASGGATPREPAAE
jgi:hypothetical protein